MPKKKPVNLTPKILSSDPGYARKEAFKSILPEGASLMAQSRKTASFGTSSLSPLNTGLMGSGGGTMYHMQRPYHPELESPDRMQLPQDRKLQNDIWRLFHKFDGVFGPAIDMYAEMCVSDFDLILDDDSQEIKDTLEYMNEITFLNEKLKFIIREYLVLGEAVPHLFFDDDLGIWTYIALHNPDNIEIKDTPFINTDPIINYIPDENLRALIQDSSKEAVELRQKLTPELVSKILARQKIRLSPTNCSFIARKLSPYDIRGTSLGTRLWRIFMIEDAAAASTIATYRRNACFVAGTKVITTKGVKYIEDVKVDDLVISGEGSAKRVEAAWEEEANEVVKLTMAGGENLECTPNHRFKLWVRPRKCACGCGEDLEVGHRSPRSFVTGHFEFRRDPKTGRYTKDKKDWKKYSEAPDITTLSDYEPIQVLNAEDINAGDYLLVPRKFDEVPMEVTEVELAKARLLGYYTAEGCIRSINHKKNNALNLTFGRHEYDTWGADSVRLGKSIGLNVRIGTRKDRNTTEINIDNVKDRWFIDWCIEHAGRYSAHKTLSETVMSWPLRMKEEFLIGLYRGDGHKSCDGENVVYASVSKSLVYQVRMILAQMGIFGSIGVQVRDDHETWDDCYKVLSSGMSNRKLRKLIWGEEVENEDKAVGGEWCWLDDDYLYMKVLKVSKREEKTKVYNLTVEGDHSYIANGIATLNSAIRVAKMGDPNSGHIPSPEIQSQMLELLAQAEIDPNAWLVHDYMVNFEAWGSNDKSISLGREGQWIDDKKLLALGLSKAFMTGDSSFSSVKGGLQVFLRRLLSMRQYFEEAWLIPKYFRPISEVNDWVKPKQSEVQHRYRIKRTAKEISEENMWIVPKIKWKNRLDPAVDTEVLGAYSQLKQAGAKVSDETMYSTAGLDFKEEFTRTLHEFKWKEDTKKKLLGETYLALMKTEEDAKGGAKPPGMPGAGAKPPAAGGKPPGGKVPPKPSTKDTGGAPGASENGPMDDSINPPSTDGMPTV